MANTYQVGSSCYADEASAYQALAISAPLSIGPNGTAAHVESVSSAGITYRFINAENGTSQTLLVAPELLPCNLLTLEDGMSLGWLFVALFATVFGVRTIRSVLIGV